MAGVSRGRSRLKGDGRPEKASAARAAGGGGGAAPHGETMRVGRALGRSLPVEEQHDLFLMYEGSPCTTASQATFKITDFFSSSHTQMLCTVVYS